MNKCCDKCYSTYTTDDWPEKQTLDACIKQNCECHMTPEKETPTLKSVAENWRDEYIGMEQLWMHLKDQYAELARALGFEGDTWFGDPLVVHGEIVSRARTLLARDAAHAEELREVVGEIFAGVEDYKVGKEMTRINTTGSDYIYVYDLKKFVLEIIAAKHGITNL